MQALSTGHALDLRSAGAGAVHSVYTHAVNLVVRGDLWTLVSAQRADLPFGIRVACQDFNALGVRRGERVDVRSGFVGIGTGSAGLVVDCRAAPRWLPAQPDRPAPGLARRLDAVAATTSQRAWHGCAEMAYAVTGALSRPDALGDVVPRVVGCGPGCTPAGDDVLVGILAVLGSVHSGAAGAAAARALVRCLLPLLPTTTDISGHLLRQAANGLFGRAVHELLSAVIADSAPERLKKALERVLDTGVTSGADMCAGILASAPRFIPGFRPGSSHRSGSLSPPPSPFRAGRARGSVTKDQEKAAA